MVVSDRQTVIADKTSSNAAERVFRVRFNLKAGTYDKKKVYRLVIANDIDVEEIEFHIDIAFADDFGWRHFIRPCVHDQHRGDPGSGFPSAGQP